MAISENLRFEAHWKIGGFRHGLLLSTRLTMSMSKAPARTMAEVPGEAGMIGGVMVFAPLGFAIVPQCRSRDAVDMGKS